MVAAQPPEVVQVSIHLVAEALPSRGPAAVVAVVPAVQIVEDHLVQAEEACSYRDPWAVRREVECSERLEEVHMGYEPERGGTLLLVAAVEAYARVAQEGRIGLDLEAGRSFDLDQAGTSYSCSCCSCSCLEVRTEVLGCSSCGLEEGEQLVAGPCSAHFRDGEEA